MEKSSKVSFWAYLLFPGLAMLLGWGLRGYIGGGPFGAMIPGAMVALAICLLYGLKSEFSSIVVVFGVVGVGLGGEMTYGQTLGILRNPDTMWWGMAGTTLKGAVWGIGGGALLAMGIIHDRISRKHILISLLLLLLGLILGFKLINDPKLIYFSDPVNKPRSESWAGLLFGSFFLIAYLKTKLARDNFSIVARFAFWGFISGGLGFGIGGLWMVLGSKLAGAMFSSWWKMMEFTFGLLFGMGLGFAAWKSKHQIDIEKDTRQENEQGIWQELGLIMLMALGIYLLIPAVLEPLADRMSYERSFTYGIFGDFLRMFVNYAFYGILMIAAALYRNALAWQIGITLTFCHTAIDWARDLRPTPETSLGPLNQLIIVAISTLFIAYLVAIYRRKENINNSMMQILVWSTVCVAFISLLSDVFIEEKFQYTDFTSIVVKTLFVHIVFLSSAIYTSWNSKAFTGFNLKA